MPRVSEKNHFPFNSIFLVGRTFVLPIFCQKSVVEVFIWSFILFENQIQTTSASPYRTQVQLAASFLVCFLIFLEYYMYF
ncbi:hypothetical protein E3V82_07310 [Streptococcus pseudopneumoniae]|nr:hypothetical protein [Streptococcus pseudopneumoniae]NIB77631.1 hypothetical protein [Streptococcus pseudopneumoniae]TMR53359.1 hypothetical protein E3V25_04250 [Streptococcus pseudopneumoniae]TMR64785.1 hypothetical protein E3V82_07310 [Streptococcus pseudopneumoniae]TMR65176.1 hypothetical protein E3V53_03825 [Streptococcus pseudopneumoniae]